MGSSWWDLSDSHPFGPLQSNDFSKCYTLSFCKMCKFEMFKRNRKMLQIIFVCKFYQILHDFVFRCFEEVVKHISVAMFADVDEMLCLKSKEKCSRIFTDAPENVESHYNSPTSYRFSLKFRISGSRNAREVIIWFPYRVACRRVPARDAQSLGFKKKK